MRVGPEIVESFNIARSAIVANKGRGTLTALGIIIGIVAVITTMTAANGLENNVRQSFSSVGADVLYVSRTPWIQMGNFMEFRNRKPISLEDTEALSRAMRNRGVVNPTINTRLGIKYQSKTMDTVNIVGTTDKQIIVSSMTPETGRFLMPFDIEYKKNVVVIGHAVAESLFSNISPLGKKIKLGRYTYRVIGVMEEQGSGGVFGGPNFDRQVFVPISTFIKTFGDRGGQANFNLAIKAPSHEELGNFEFEVIGEMRRVRKLTPSEADNFAINKLDSLMGAYNSIMGVVVLIGILITGISLFVGGVGVMNIMFVSVTERTREIGIRKAIGARRRSILMQFLFESSVICLIGGVIGIALSAVLTYVINAVLMPASLSPGRLLTAVIVSVRVGVWTGLVPAWRGARLDPIEALRYE
jgi:putative ABC transport system permease protein